jgi:thiol-disulfide isomerase/thioredoxin
MLHPLKALLPALTTLALGAPAFADGPTWHADFDVAAAEATKSGKDLLVDFTGSDWCIWCKRLDKEVFALEAFQKGVENDFVLVALDFPQAPEVAALVPNPVRNNELQAQYGIEGFPTILLMSAAGEVYGRTGYRPGGPEQYVEHLAELRTSGKRALAEIGGLIEAFDKAEGDARPAAWDKVADLAATLDGDSPFGARLAAPLQAAFTLDPANEQGRKLRAVELLFELGQVDDAVLAVVSELDPDNAKGLLEQTLQPHFAGVRDDATARAAIEALAAFEAKAKFKEPKLATQYYVNAAMWLSGPLKDMEAAKPWAQKALDLKPDSSELVAALEQIVAGTFDPSGH